jgi:hypothetical protein
LDFNNKLKLKLNIYNKPEQIIKTLTAAQIKSLLRLTDTPYNNKMKKEELRSLAVAKSDITSAIIINHLQLDKYNLQKKINNPPKARKKKKILSSNLYKVFELICLSGQGDGFDFVDVPNNARNINCLKLFRTKSLLLFFIYSGKLILLPIVTSGNGVTKITYS